MDEICNAVPFKKFKMIQCRSENTSENDKKLRQMRNERHLELTLLRKTVESGDIAKVKELLKQQPPLNCRVGGLMLWHAVSHNHLEIATMLVDAGADLFVRKESDDSESSFLHVLMSSNDPRHHRLAVQMMNRGADVNAADEHYLTVLQTALLAKSPAKLITEIVNHGADVNISSIMNATEYLDSRELLMLLVDKFLNVGSRSRLVERLLLRCGYTEQDETRILPIVQKLLDEKLPVAEINRNGSTLVAAVHSGKIQMVKLLIEYGFDVNTSGISPLYEILDCILPINSEPVGELPLYAASASDRPDITKLLIAAGAEINTPSSCSVFYTGYPLHAACGRRNEENIRLLLRHGADVNLMDKHLFDQYVCVDMGGCLSNEFCLPPDITQYEEKSRRKLMLQQQSCQLRVLRGAVISADKNGVRELLWYRPGLNSTEGGMILWDAVSLDEIEIASMLVDAGANLDVKGPIVGGRSNFLHVLVKNNNPRHYRLAVQMMEYGADVNAVDGHDVTVLERALEAGPVIELIKILMKYGARVNSSAIMTAVERSLPKNLLISLVNAYFDVETRSEQIEDLLFRCGRINVVESKVLPVVEMVLDKNLSVAQINRSCNTLVAAIRSGKTKMVKLLIDYGFDVNAPTAGETPLYGISKINIPLQVATAGELPLYAASASDRPEISKLLIEAGAEINTASSYSIYYTGYPLHAACGRRCEENIRLLLRNGADVNLTDSRLRTPFAMINYFGYVTESHKMLIRHFALLESKEKTVNESDLNLVQDCPEMLEYYCLCMDELRKMKMTKIIDDVSYFCLFTASKNRLCYMVRSQYFVKKYAMQNIQVMFPNYYDDMTFVFETAEYHRRQLNDIEELLYEQLLSRLPNIPIERIIYFYCFNQNE
ncbi:poly [ADP-ribose] polymerase tankyrase-1-like [Phymastichus coffea]|uniref:poly [ADP-ribose] polymerase tankyrase-1-like n=1 Tax=Phymastichus coffea TaxID=108790 RepID=UPI00273AAA11|nr:poly [ADP-ribose] polymerase tankyrase-1-like [Phymastichus coffea]